MPNNKILISACLIRQNVRYNAQILDFNNPIVEKWKSRNLLIPICPEVEGNLPVPRESAEIINGDGKSVWENETKVNTISGMDITKAFKSGALQTLRIAKENNIGIAVLKARSPSCGNNQIYNGTFQGVVKDGSGVTAALLIENGITVFSEEELDAAFQFWLKGGR